MSGVADLRVSYTGSASAQVQTNEMGMVATGASRPAGSNTAALEGMAVGKPIAGDWEFELTNLPGGMAAEQIDDIVLMLSYRYEPAH